MSIQPIRNPILTNQSPVKRARKKKKYTCSICFESDLQKNQFITKCLHVFHKNCLTSWTNKNNTCPMCRKENPYEKYSSSFDENLVRNMRLQKLKTRAKNAQSSKTKKLPDKNRDQHLLWSSLMKVQV